MRVYPARLGVWLARPRNRSTVAAVVMSSVAAFRLYRALYAFNALLPARAARAARAALRVFDCLRRVSPRTRVTAPAVRNSWTSVRDSFRALLPRPVQGIKWTRAPHGGGQWGYTP